MSEHSTRLFIGLPSTELGDCSIYQDLGGDKKVVVGTARGTVGRIGDGDAKAPALANARLWAAAPAMFEALEAIERGEGRFSRDPLTHATNCVEDMQALARDALAKARGES